MLGSWVEADPALCGDFFGFPFLLYIQKIIELQKSIENTINLGKIQNRFL
jgi:hypothetical protein